MSGLFRLVVAAACGIFAYSLLQAERRGSEPDEPAGSAPADESEAVCRARTKSGRACTRRPEAGSEYCWQHGG